MAAPERLRLSRAAAKAAGTAVLDKVSSEVELPGGAHAVSDEDSGIERGWFRGFVLMVQNMFIIFFD